MMARESSTHHRLDVSSLDVKHRQAESTYIGPTDIKVRVAVSQTFYPLNWQTSAPRFTSCFDKSQRQASRQRTKSTDREDVAHGSTASLTEAHQGGQKRPRSTSESASQLSRQRGRTSSVSCPAGVSASVSWQQEHAETSALHASAVAIELSSLDMRSDSWLTSTLIDAVLHKLSLAYPHVHFMPCEFMAWILPQASKRGAWKDFCPVDMLSRPVLVEADAIPPLYDAPPWYHCLPNRAPQDAQAAEASNSSNSSDGQASAFAKPAMTRARSSVAYSSFVPCNLQSVKPFQLPSRALTPMERLRFLTDGAQYVSLMLAAIEQCQFEATDSTGEVLEATVSAVKGRLDVLLGQRHPVPKDVDVHAVVHLVLALKQQQAGAGSGSTPGVTHDRRQLPAVWASHLSYKRPLSYVAPQYRSNNKPIVLCWHERANHWLTIAVHTGAMKRIEVFEPFGKTERKAGHSEARRHAPSGPEASQSDDAANSNYNSVGLSLRSLPVQLLQWLDVVCPLPEGSWRGRSRSAITTRHQINGYDCGPAALLYAEKVASGLTAHTICAYTDQAEISTYREKLKAYLQALQASAPNQAAR